MQNSKYVDSIAKVKLVYEDGEWSRMCNSENNRNELQSYL